MKANFQTLIFKIFPVLSIIFMVWVTLQLKAFRRINCWGGGGGGTCTLATISLAPLSRFSGSTLEQCVGSLMLCLVEGHRVIGGAGGGALVLSPQFLWPLFLDFLDPPLNSVWVL